MWEERVGRAGESNGVNGDNCNGTTTKIRLTLRECAIREPVFKGVSVTDVMAI